MLLSRRISSYQPYLEKNPDCKLAMDFESFGSLGREEINQIALTFMQTVKNVSGKDVIIYSDEYNANSTLLEMEKGRFMEKIS